MEQTKNKNKKIQKGAYGYIRREKIRRLLITLLMFAIPLAIFFTGMAMHHTRNNILTVVAMVGIIPAARFAVSWIMIMTQKSAPEEIFQITEQKAANLARAYELIVTAYEGRMPLDAVVICGNNVVCYSSRGQQDKIAFMQRHIEKALSTDNFFDMKVKILQDKNAYVQRISQLAEKPDSYREGRRYKPDPRYPDEGRDQLAMRTIMAISL